LPGNRDDGLPRIRHHRICRTGGQDMKDSGKWAVAIAAVFGLLFASSWPADAKPASAKAENKPCSFCHVGKAGDKIFTDAGKFYGKNHTLKGFGEETKAPAKAAPAPATVPAQAAAAPAASEGAPMDKPMADAATPCGCGCACCMEKCGKHLGHAHDKGTMPPMREKMKGHLEEMRKAVSELRENEIAVEGAADIEALRNSVLFHLRKLDDLQESRLRHMESMAESRDCGKPGPPHMHSR